MIHCRGLMMTMKSTSIGILIGLVTVTSTSAAGWSSVHKYVKRSGNCAGQEILASHYSSGSRTASGERFDASGNTAAARTWPLGTVLTVTNPKNGKSVTVRINDRGPDRKSTRLNSSHTDISRMP